MVQLLKVYKPEDVYDFIAYGLGLVFDSFLVPRKPTAEQVLEIAQTLVKKYNDYTLEVFAYFFKQAKQGKFGKVLQHLDGPMIYRWIEQFDQDYEAEKMGKIMSYESKKSDHHSERAALIIGLLDKTKIGPINKFDAEKEKKATFIYNQFKELLKEQKSTDGKVEWMGKRIDLNEFITANTNN